MGCAKHTVHQPASQQQQLQNTRKFSVVFQSNPNTELWPKKFFRQRLTRCAVRRIVHIHYGFRCRCSTWMRAPSSGNLFCCGKSAVIFYSTENTPRSLFVCMGCIRGKKNQRSVLVHVRRCLALHGFVCGTCDWMAAGMCFCRGLSVCMGLSSECEMWIRSMFVMDEPTKKKIRDEREREKKQYKLHHAPNIWRIFIYI